MYKCTKEGFSKRLRCRVPHPNVAFFATLGWDLSALNRMRFSALVGLSGGWPRLVVFETSDSFVPAANRAWNSAHLARTASSVLGSALSPKVWLWWTNRSRLPGAKMKAGGPLQRGKYNAAVSKR